MLYKFYKYIAYIYIYWCNMVQLYLQTGAAEIVPNNGPMKKTTKHPFCYSKCV